MDATCYAYRPDTGELVGPTQGDPSPLEPGVVLYPAFTTLVAPPGASSGKAIAWSGAGWVKVPDHRGETWWQESRPIAIDFLGDPAARGLTASAPPPPVSTVTVVLRSDLFRRCTDDEADQIQAKLSETSTRMQNLFASVQTFRSDAPEWDLLMATAVGLFGADRAAVLLAPSPGI